MANMSYCRFQNTVNDLRDCYENMDDNDLSEDEARARKRMLTLCSQIVSYYADELPVCAKCNGLGQIGSAGTPCGSCGGTGVEVA